MVVAVARVSLIVSHAHSLKEKRSVIRKIKDRIAARFDVRVAEVGGLDLWQRAVLGLAVVGAERHVVEGVRDEVVRAIEGLAEGEVVAVDRDVLVFDELGLS